MSNFFRQLLQFRISDYAITGFFFFLGVLFTLWMFFASPATVAFFQAFTHPLIATLYYFWLKALILDTKRIMTHEDATNYMPGLIYWFYGLAWFATWAIDDLAFSNAQLRSLVTTTTGFTTSLYFSHRELLFLALDFLATILIYPFRLKLIGKENISKYVVMDVLKYLVIFGIFTFIVLI
jgi:hypothetical protein